MKRLLAALLLACWAALAAAQMPPKPGPKDLCAVCGMLVAKYPNWTATVVWKDGHAHHFDGAKDMFKFLHALDKYVPGHKREDIAGLFVTDFYNLEKIDARKALYVVGSDVLGPMGFELVPLAGKDDAGDFMKDHKGKRIYAFDQVSPRIVAAVDDGRH